MPSNTFNLPPVKRGDKVSAKRDAEIVRLLKRTITGPNVQETSMGWHIRRDPSAGGKPIMLKAQVDFDADDTEYDAKYLEADGTAGGTIKVRRPNGVYVKNDQVGFLGKDSSGQNIFIDAHNWPEVPDATDSVGVLTEGAEAADTDTYDATSSANGLALDIMTRVAYFDAGNKTLYGYTRRITFDEMGHLVTVSAETRVTVDVPALCP